MKCVKFAATLHTHTDVLAAMSVSVGETASKSLLETLCTFKSHSVSYTLFLTQKFMDRKGIDGTYSHRYKKYTCRSLRTSGLLH